MTDATMTPARPTGWFYRLPIVGWFARDLSRDFLGNIWYFLLIVLTGLVLAVKTWGLVALTLTAVCMTPVMFVILLLITVGR